MDGRLGLTVGDCSDYINEGMVYHGGWDQSLSGGILDCVCSIHLLLFASLLWIQCG